MPWCPTFHLGPIRNVKGWDWLIYARFGPRRSAEAIQALTGVGNINQPFTLRNPAWKVASVGSPPGITRMFSIRPQIVAVSSQSGFLHLIQTLLDTLGLAVRTTSDWRAAPGLVERARPKLVVLDLVPGQEAECWLALEAIKARPPTQSIPVLVCAVAGWLLAGHETRLALHRVHVWPEGFELDDLLEAVQVALAA